MPESRPRAVLGLLALVGAGTTAVQLAGVAGADRLVPAALALASAVAATAAAVDGFHPAPITDLAPLVAAGS